MLFGMIFRIYIFRDIKKFSYVLFAFLEETMNNNVLNIKNYYSPIIRYN